MENLPTQKTPEQIISEKRNNWANLGEKTHFAEITLQEKAVLIHSKLIIPKSIEEIPSAEASLKQAKQEANALIEERKLLTGIFDKLTDRLRKPEKALFETIFPEAEKALLSLKQQQKANNERAEAKNKELKSLRENVAKWINDAEFAFKNRINKQCTFAYNYALGEGNIDEKTYSEYYKAVEAKLKPEEFVVPKMHPQLITVSIEEYNLIWDELSLQIKPASFYVGSPSSLYESTLSKTFEFFTIALKNKEAAIEQQKTKAAEEAAALEKENANKNAAATLASVAVPLDKNEGPKAKDLKTVYELDMEENETSMLAIMSAFAANFELTREHRKAKEFSFNVGQMAACLVKVKNKDEKFECSGIKFKQVDKL